MAYKFILILITFLPNFSSASMLEHCSLKRIIDGDTLIAECDKLEYRVRLYCIDAPEKKQYDWGKHSTDYLSTLIRSEFILNIYNVDFYHRNVGEIFTGNINVNKKMVESGYASVYKNYCKNPTYYELENQAKLQKLGIWSVDNKELQQTPSLFRKRN